MAYDYQRLFSSIIGSVSAGGAVRDRMQALIAQCAEQRPHPDWDRFSDIAFHSDQPLIETWLTRAFPNALQSPGYLGLWFGLHNPVIRGKATADIYVGASREFDQSSIEWACSADVPPHNSSLRSHVLAQIYSIAYASKNGLGNDAEYPLALGYGGIIAQLALSQLAIPESLASLQGAAMGFDSGDFLLLGRFLDSTFHPDVVAG